MCQQDPWQQGLGTEAGHSGELNGEKKLEQSTSWYTENLNGKGRSTRLSLFLHQPRSDLQAALYSNLSPESATVKYEGHKNSLVSFRKQCYCRISLLLANVPPSQRNNSKPQIKQNHGGEVALERQVTILYTQGTAPQGEAGCASLLVDHFACGVT